MTLIKNLRFVSNLVPVSNSKRKSRLMYALAILGIGAFAAVLVHTALATPPFNILSGIVVARGTFLDPVDIKFKINPGNEEVIRTAGTQDTVMQQIIIGPGGHTGWHSHPGPAVALIKAGTLAIYSSADPTCTPRIYSAGQAFVDAGQGHVHMGRNMSATDNVEVWVTYFDVPPGGSPRLDEPSPGICGF